jgi:hypothetical protein
MKRALMLVLLCSGIPNLALAQRPLSPRQPAAPPPPETAVSKPVDITRPDQTDPPDVVGKTPSVVTNNEEARELPLDSETFDVRVQRRVAEYERRHQQRELRMSSYDKATVGDPGFGRFADPRKVQVELTDELDRERTSEELSADYAQQAHEIESAERALQEFIEKRRQTIEELTKQDDGASRRSDLEVALANLARQPSSPETLAAMREIDRKLSETERNGKDLPTLLLQNQQETADATAELANLQALRQGYEKEAKAFTADALSARQNRLRLANKLEYFVVRAQAEDTLEQGRKALGTAQHLSASAQVENQLRTPGSTSKSDASLEQLRDCITKSGDVKACRQAMHQE